MALANTTSRAERSGAEGGWLRRELRQVLPRGRRRAQRPGRFLLALFDGERLQIVKRTPRHIEEWGVLDLGPDEAAIGSAARDVLLARLRKSRLPLVLRLDESCGLFCADSLPAGARQDLRPIIANKLDLLTPWSDEQAHFAIVDVEEADSRLEVTIAVAPRQLLASLVQRLGRLGLEPAVVDMVDGDPFDPPAFDLRESVSQERTAFWFKALLFLVLAGVIAGAGLVGRDIWQREQLLRERRDFAAALERRLEDVPALRARIDSLRDTGSFIARRRAEYPSAAITLEMLSRLLADTVWLTSMSMQHDELALSGYADDAAALLPLLEQSPYFSATEFRAPSTRVQLDLGDREFELDRFSLAATIEPRRRIDLE